MTAARCPSASRAGSALRISSSASPNGRSSGAATQIATGRDTHTLARTCLVLALPFTATPHEAMVAASGLIDAAEATRNPYALSFALMAYGLVFRDADPDRALDALRRGLVIAHDSGNRTIETHLTHSLALLEANSATRSPRSNTSLRASATPRLGQHRQYAWLSHRPRRIV